MKTGREREVAAIVTHDRAVEVANLLLGELNRPMRRIFPDQYLSRVRRQLKSGLESLQDGKREELEDFCLKNFGTKDIKRLAGIYERLYENDSQLRMPYKEFVRLVGHPHKGVLGTIPRHSTISVSQWGLQCEFPEQHLARDLVVAFNSAAAFDAQIKQHKGTSWEDAKRIRRQMSELKARGAFHRRMCLLCCFNLIEAYINGMAWDFTESHDISSLSKNKQELLTSSKASIREKMERVPELVTGTSPGPLSHDKDPMKAFMETIKPFRDSIVHASPFSAPVKFGGYDKLSKVYELTFEMARESVDLTINIIGLIHRFLGGEGNIPTWIPARSADGTFEFDKMI